MENTERYCYKYPRPAVTTDNVIFGFDEGELKVLLIERKGEPFAGCWALPGGFMNMDEDADTCARRELEEETGLKDIFAEQLYAFTDVDRDPRYRVVSIAYYALVRLTDHALRAGDDAAKAQWFTVSQLPPLAFDHCRILQMAWERLKEKIRYQPIGFELLPEKFTISDLQCLYESVLQITLNYRSFRRKILCTGLVIDTSERVGKGAHKGTKYYSFDREKYKRFAEKGFYPGI